MARTSLGYQELNKELEAILTKLQSGELDIDEAVKAYERGINLVNELESYLQKVQNKITSIKTGIGDA